MKDSLLDHRYKRLIFQAHHRGMKENDLLLGDFARQYLHRLSPEQMDVFESLLSHVTDADVYAWVSENQSVPSQYDEMIKLIRYVHKIK